MLAKTNQSSAIERVLIQGDLSGLSECDRINYYRSLCDSLGLNFLSRPFDYIWLNGKLTLYARRECTEQLRKIHQVSIQIVSRELIEDIYVVTARASLPDGRCDESIGAVFLGNLQGEARSNALMRGESKAKRRVTLSLCGLAFLDELEVQSIPNAMASPAVGIAVEEPEIWRSWSCLEDAIAWASSQLPDRSAAELHKLFNELPAKNGKKAPAFTGLILDLASRESHSAA